MLPRRQDEGKEIRMVRTTVKIDGMACGMCESHINDVIRKTFPEAEKVSSSHKKGEAVFVTPEEVNEGVLVAAIEKTGYHDQGCESVPWEKHGLFGRKR